MGEWGWERWGECMGERGIGWNEDVRRGGESGEDVKWESGDGRGGGGRDGEVRGGEVGIGEWRGGGGRWRGVEGRGENEDM